MDIYETLTKSEYPTPEEMKLAIHRAHELRVEAIRGMFSALGNTIRTGVFKVRQVWTRHHVSVHPAGESVTR